MNTISKIVRGKQSSFFWIMQLLPKPKRMGAYTLFAFNNHIEKEIVKSNMPKAEKIEMLKAWQEEIDNIFDKKAPETEIGRKIYKNCLRFSLTKDLFINILKAHLKSLRHEGFNPDLEEYIEYCHNVYGSKIEMGMMIFGESNKKVVNLMAEFIHTVVALRDMKDDCLLNFIYLPKEFLKEAGITSAYGPEILVDPKLHIARSSMGKFAINSLNELEACYKELDKQNLKLIRGFVNIYKKYLDIMQNRGFEVIAPKPYISNFEKLKIIFKSVLTPCK